MFKRYYDVAGGGNWEGKTILNRLAHQELADAETEAELARCREILFAARAPRVRPGLDDKILADWNGLMIAALAEAGLAFDRPDWVALGARAFAFIIENMTGGDGRLRHSWREGSARHPASVDDYANLCRAALALHEATADDSYLARARQWVGVLDRHYWDNAGGGYFFAADDTADLITRVKSATDAAVPSGNGTMVGVLTRLALLTGDDGYRRRAEAIIGAFSGELARNFFPLATLINNAELAQKPLQIVLAGNARHFGLRRIAAGGLSGITAEPGGAGGGARRQLAGEPSGPRQGSGRRQGGGLCLRGPGLLAAADRAAGIGGQPGAAAIMFSKCSNLEPARHAGGPGAIVCPLSPSRARSGS